MFIGSDFVGELRLSRKFKGAFLFHPNVLAAAMALDEEVRGHRKLKGTIFFSTKFLGELFCK